MRHITVSRSERPLVADPYRVIAKYYRPAEELIESEEPRVARLVRRVLALPEEEVIRLLKQVTVRFSSRHRNFQNLLARNFEEVIEHIPAGTSPTTAARMLIGAYLTQEFAIEAAALFNPSIVPAPDQSGLADGQQRFVMSMRAVGEGHISSIEFRTGVVDRQSRLAFEPVSPYATTGVRRSPKYSQRAFAGKLRELGADNHITSGVLGPLHERFTYSELQDSITEFKHDGIPPAISHKTLQLIQWVADSNYEISFDPATPISERVIFPFGPAESRGMEDARFVRFTDDDGSVIYYATYTAFDGFKILPQLIETKDFSSFRVSTLNGASAQNKGMALFPRRIGGQFVALSRYDQENIDIMFSDDIRRWDSRQKVRAPTRPWELMQIGNCGSPIETPAGWLVLTHGVGPVREYSIGALLLDRDEPTHVIGELPEPLLVADEHERYGYVPNVVYSCGAMIHGGNLVLPYGYSDAGIRIAIVKLDDLLGALLDHSPHATLRGQ
jgi:predicted GH43/DUF377 family glycosyl hydrolase